MTSTGPTTSDVLVVGGGVIGLACAWRAAQRGLTVTVLDPAPGSGASHAAAGMLTPVTEAHFGEEAQLALNLDSARRWPGFAAEVESAAGQSVGLRREGTLAVAFDADDRAALDELHGFQQRLGLATERLTARECRALEPLLAPAIRGGLLVSGDYSVNNRRLVAALLVAVERAGIRVLRRRAARILLEGDRVTGAEDGSGDRLLAGTTVLAAGCWSADLPGLPEPVRPPVRPLKGQILRLRPPAYPTGLPTEQPFLSRSVRGLVSGFSLYLVPRAGGEVVLGATMEERGFDTSVTVGGVYELLRDAHALLPGVTELELTETHAGLRPGSPDNAPLIGPAACDGLVLATGHGRNGILLSAVTADLVAAILAGESPAGLERFSPLRFAGRPAVPA